MIPGVAVNTLRPVDAVLCIGESNAGGHAENTPLTAAELAVRSNVQILNNTTLTLQSLQIGVNNLIGHTGLADNASHGIENGLANSVDEGTWPSGKVYLLKSGQGGSTIAQWAVGNASGYWSTFLTRLASFNSAISALGARPNWKVFYSLGINDDGAATPTATFQTNTLAMISLMRQTLGGFKLGYTMLPPVWWNGTGFLAYSVPINNIIAAHPDNFLIDTTNFPPNDDGRDHWDYVGFRGMITQTINGWWPQWSSVAAPTATPGGGTYGTAQSVTLSSATPGASIYYTKDTEFAGANYGTLYTTAVTMDQNPQTLQAKAVKSGLLPTNMTTQNYLVGAAHSQITWGNLANATQVGNNIVSNTLLPGGGVGTSLTVANGFHVYVYWPDPNSVNATVVMLSSSASTNFNWDATNSYLAGAYTTGGPLYWTVLGGSSTQIGGTVPSIGRFSNSGTDILLHYSTDGGSTWTLGHTFTGALSGVPTIWIRALFAVAGDVAGNGHKIHVDYTVP